MKTFEKVAAILMVMVIMCSISWAVGARAGAKHAIENAEIVSTEEIEFNLLPLYFGIGGCHLYE